MKKTIALTILIIAFLINETLYFPTFNGIYLITMICRMFLYFLSLMYANKILDKIENMDKI